MKPNRIAALLLCLWLTPLLAQPDTPARDQLENLARGLDTLHAEFSQRVIRSDGTLEDESHGQFWMARPQQFRWEYGGDFPEIVVADGERIWIHDVTLEQVTVRLQSEAAADSPLTVLTDMGRLDDEFEVREAGDIDGLALLELRPVDSDAEFDRVLLGLRDDTLALMAMEDAFGLRTEIRFAGVQRNEPLDAALFRFEPPPEADVIGDTEAAADRLGDRR